VRTVLTALLAGGLVLLVGCFKAGPTVTTPTISITLVPSATNVTPGQSVTVMANVYDLSGQGATWTVSPLNFGALSQQTTTSVIYTAPINFPTAVTVTISATSIANPTITSSVQIAATPISVSLTPLSAQTMNQGEQLVILANVANDLSGKGTTWTLSPASGAGSLSGQTLFSVTYQAPTTVSLPTTVTVSASSVASPNAIASVQITVLASGAGPNVSVLSVDGGPVPGQVYANAAFTSVTICNPGSTSACQTVGGILVDTGSYGLRILQSEIPLLKLSQLSDGNGDTLENCASLPDGSFLWGPVSIADIYISGETASSVLTQVISSSQDEVVPDGCSNGGTTNENTPELLGANGILGVGPEPTDCTVSGVNYCDGSVQPVPPNVYYSCPSTGCTSSDSAVIVPAIEQMENPIPLFGADSNGVILQFPPVSGSEVSISGSLIFGIGTEPNNGLGAATIFTLDASDHFTTIFNGQTLTSSSFDSGSNGLFFPDALPTCADNAQFFCPVSSLSGLSATIEGASQGESTVNFNVTNADDLFSSSGYAVFPTLAGPQGSYNSCANGNASCVFDWGLPFFYGRSVYAAIDGRVVYGIPAPPVPPWWAY
jgi:hypothetical protein